MALNQIRQRIVNAANGALHAKSHFRYAEVRPIPFALFDELMDGKTETIITDCSGLATCCYQRAGALDPNGGDYHEPTMYTGTMMATLAAIPLSKAQPGDLAVFGSFPGKHVVLIVGTGPDPACISHGGPGDPKEAPLSHFESIGVLSVLKGVVAVPIIGKRKPATHIVSGKNGEKVGHTRRPHFWAVRHPKVFRENRRHLHFDEIEHTHTTNAAIHTGDK